MNILKLLARVIRATRHIPSYVCAIEYMLVTLANTAIPIHWPVLVVRALECENISRNIYNYSVQPTR